MSLCRYKALLSYLPGMASVVNSFHSNEVQQAVFAELMQALNTRMDQEGVARKAGLSVGLKNGSRLAPVNGDDLAHDLIEGESIHAAPPKG